MAAPSPAPRAGLRPASLAAATGLMALLWVLSDQSDPNPASGLAATVSSQAAHLVAYGALAWLWWRGLGDRALPAFVIAVAYGVTDELHQASTPGRDATAVDVAFDAAGAAVALTLARIRRASSSSGRWRR